MSGFPCIPACWECKQAGACIPKPEPVGKNEHLRTRAITNPHDGTIRLPCGHYGLPWPIFEVFGSGIKEIFCDYGHGWLKITKEHKAKMKKSGAKATARTAELFDDDSIPF